MKFTDVQEVRTAFDQVGLFLRPGLRSYRRCCKFFSEIALTFHCLDLQEMLVVTVQFVDAAF
jgi:hypothetical protein